MTLRHPPRKVSDPTVLKALAHPLRRRLIEVLAVHGPATVSMLSERLDEPVGLLSYHLGQLAKYDFIEEVPELARDRRERWWRFDRGVSWSDAARPQGGLIGQLLDDPADRATANAAFAVHTSVHFERIQRFRESLPAWGKDWASAAHATDTWFEMTPDELHEMAEEIETVMGRWHRREVPDDGQERESVFMFMYAFPHRV